MHMRALFLYGFLSLGLLVAGRVEAQSCAGHCGSISAGACWCDEACTFYGDCCGDYVGTCLQPVVTQLTPSSLSTAGGVVTLAGNTFGKTTGSVKVGTLTCAPMSWGNTLITCTVPPGVGANLTASVTSAVSQTGSLANAFSFAAPVINGVSPSRVGTAGGTSVTLSGNNFGPSGAQVTVSATTATVTTSGQTSLVITTPPGEGAAEVLTVTAGGQTATASLGRFAPVITGIMPTVVPSAGTSLTLSGTDFGVSTPSVTVGGSNCPVSSHSHTQVVCTSPGASTAQVSLVLTAAGQASPAFLAPGVAAALQSLTPSTGPTSGGTVLTLTGQSLNAATPTVTVGGSPCPVSVFSSNLILCTTPPGVGPNQPVVATIGGTVSNALLFSYAAPSLSSLTPATGPTVGGTTLTLGGTNFGTTATGLSVTVGGVDCPVSAFSQTQVKCTLPAGIGQVPVLLTRGTQSSNELVFTYGSPLIASLSPATPSTQGGTVLTVIGSNFGATSAKVSIDGVTCPVVSQTQTQVLCMLPPGNGGTSTLQLTTPSDPVGATASLTWAAPSVASWSPANGPAGGGTTLTLVGSNFGLSPRTVTVGGASCDVSAQTQTVLKCLTPAGSGPSAVVVQPGNVSGGTFTYDAPFVSSLSPTHGPTAGGTVVTLTGASLTGATLTVGTASVAFQSLHDTAATFVMPAGQGSVSVVASRGGQSSASSVFTYDAPTLSALSPTSLPWRGGTLTLTGTNFGVSPTVTVGAQPASVSSSTQTQAVVTVPQSSGLVTGDSVQLAAGSALSNVLTLGYDEASVSGLSPTHGPTSGGTALTLTGASLDRPGLSVTVGGASCAQLAGSSATKWVCSTPAGVGAAAVVLARGAVTVGAGTFTYDAPVLSSLTPVDASTAGGTLLTLQGSNFGASGTVTVGGVPVSPVSGGWSDTQVVVTLPAGAGGTVPVVLSRSGESAQTTYHYAAPALSGLTPSTGPTAGGTTLTLSGASLGTGGTVTIGGNAASVTSWSHTRVLVSTPQGVGPNQPVVLTRAGETAQTTFSYAAPAISGLSPLDVSTAGGGPVTLTGTNFSNGAVGGPVTVTVDGVSASVGVWSDTQIVFSLPAGAGGTVPVVLSRSGESTQSTYHYASPTLTSLTPTTGPTAGGTTLTLSGASLGTGGTVTIGGTPASVTSWSHTRVLVTTPIGVGANLPVVLTRAGETAQSTFSYAAPSIASLAPAEASTAGGSLVTLTGTNFGTSGTVAVGGASASVGSWSDGVVIFTLPAGAGGTVPVVLTRAGETVQTTYHYAAPALSGLTPTSGPAVGGTTLTLTGTSLGTSGTVTVGGGTAAQSSWSHTRVVVTTPAGVGANVPVVLTRAGETAQTTFSYAAPSIASLAPGDASTAGGTTLTLTGANFGSTGSLTVGGTTATVGTWSDGAILFTLPPGAGGTVPVVVTRNGESAQTTYHYAAPSLALMSPTSGPAAGGTTLTLAGTSFGTSGTVTVGGVDATVTSWSHTRVLATTPRGVGVNVPVVLTRAQESVQASFTYQAPVISGLSPSGASTVGGTLLTVSGVNFGTSGTVTIGGVEATVGTWSDGAVTVTLPPGAGGTVPVALTRSGETASSTYTYGAPHLTALSPSSGPTAGGVRLTLTGSNFGDGTATTVTLGGAACPGVVSTHAQLTCTLPEGQGTAQAVVVTVAGVSATGSYDYGAPVLTSLTPTQLPAGGGTLQVSGSNFGLTPTVTVGGNACVLGAHDDQQVTCTAPPGTGTQPVVVTVGGQVSGSLPVNYAPSITLTSFSPTTAPTGGGTVLLLEGTGLAQATVSISGASCAVLKATDTSVACVLPATPAGPATVTATSPAGMASRAGLEFVASCGVDLADGASCDDGNPCTGPGRCAGTVCVGGAVANEGVACDDGNACTGSGSCTNGVCVAGAANPGTACVDTAPCTGVGTCAAGVCGQATPVREGLSCGLVSGATCTAGVCVAPPDAGVDAGVFDGGTEDGGAVDGGAQDDGGVVDGGGSEDGGLVDGGSVDAGTPHDGGVSDAGALDDAGVGVDAGTGGLGGGGTGCGCTSTPGALWLGLLAALVLRRRSAP
jgi:hypothetical protein